MEQNIKQSLQSTLVNGRVRNGFLFNQLGRWAIDFEGKVYRWMDKLCPDYNGGCWDFFKLNNGGFFMAPSAEERFLFFAEGNGYESRIDSESAGIIVTLFTLCGMAHSFYQRTDIFTEKYHQLLDFAKGHPQKNEIMAAID